MRSEVESVREREAAKIYRAYTQRLTEDRATINQQQDEAMDKKSLYKKELREKLKARVAIEKGRLELELTERVRDLKI
jgi:hypothetical protein